MSKSAVQSPAAVPLRRLWRCHRLSALHNPQTGHDYRLQSHVPHKFPASVLFPEPLCLYLIPDLHFHTKKALSAVCPTNLSLNMTPEKSAPADNLHFRTHIPQPWHLPENAPQDTSSYNHRQIHPVHLLLCLFQKLQDYTAF